MLKGEYVNRVDVVSSLPPHLDPFKDTVFFSNGKKSSRAGELGKPHYIFPALNSAMGKGEDMCHALYKPDTAIGPYSIGSIPYPFVTALAKGTPARKILYEEGYRHGIGAVSDVVIGFEKKGRSFAITAHKLKKEADRLALMNKLYGISWGEDVIVNTMAGIYQFDMAKPSDPGKLYLVKVIHGKVKRDLDMEKLAAQLAIGSPTSGSMDSDFILKNVVNPDRHLPVTVTRFDESEIRGKLSETHVGSLMVSNGSGGGGKFIERIGTLPTGNLLIEPIGDDNKTEFVIPSEDTRFVESVAFGFI